MPDTKIKNAIKITQFLEKTPPNQQKLISGLLKKKIQTYPPSGGRTISFFKLPFEDIFIDCPSSSCNGKRFFKCENNNNSWTLYSEWDSLFLDYKCKNCEEYDKTFAILIKESEKFENHCYVVKLGEWPTYGPRTPARVIKMIGPDRGLYLKGRQSEIAGLGIGAFSYYRRLVENQKGRLIENIIKVANITEYDKELIAILEKAKIEDQFSKSIELIKDNIPSELFINKNNPLSLLHKALSVGIHTLSDEECLEYAESIRTVLYELASRISKALKDRTVIKKAIDKLNKSKS